MEKLSKKVKKLNQDPDIIDVIIENEDELIANTMYEKGIKQKAEETAKKMLDKGMKIEDIIELTGLSKEEISNLKEV